MGEALRYELCLGSLLGSIMKSKPLATESQEQRALIHWARLQSAPEYKLLHSIPNGGLRNKATAGRMKAEGVLPGIPDLFLPVARANWHGLYIEMKSEGGRLSRSQRDICSRLVGQRYFVGECHGWEMARDLIKWYLSNEG